jgi:hypothetical protein
MTGQNFERITTGNERERDTKPAGWLSGNTPGLLCSGGARFEFWPGFLQSFQARGKVPVHNKLSTKPWRRMAKRRYSFTILNRGTKWSWVASFTPRPLYSQGKSPRYPLDKRLGGPKSRSGRCGVEKITCPCREWNPESSARSISDWAIPALRQMPVLYPNSATTASFQILSNLSIILRFDPYIFHALTHREPTKMPKYCLKRFSWSVLDRTEMGCETGVD